MEGLLKYQSFISESLQQENNKFKECNQSFNFDSALKEAKVYQDKLNAMKKDVVSLQDKSQRLKERALKLHSKKQKEALDLELKRDRIQEEERKLSPLIRTSSVASSSSSSHT